jgi:hypothetical protein
MPDNRHRCPFARWSDDAVRSAFDRQSLERGGDAVRGRALKNGVDTFTELGSIGHVAYLSSGRAVPQALANFGIGPLVAERWPFRVPRP